MKKVFRASLIKRAKKKSKKLEVKRPRLDGRASIDSRKYKRIVKEMGRSTEHKSRQVAAYLINSEQTPTTHHRIGLEINTNLEIDCSYAHEVSALRNHFASPPSVNVKSFKSPKTKSKSCKKLRDPQKKATLKHPYANPSPKRFNNTFTEGKKPKKGGRVKSANKSQKPKLKGLLKPKTKSTIHIIGKDAQTLQTHRNEERSEIDETDLVRELNTARTHRAETLISPREKQHIVVRPPPDTKSKLKTLLSGEKTTCY